MTDEIDAKLARIGSRIEAQRNAVTLELERTALLGPIEAARQRFGARLTWLKTDRIEVGKEPEAGIVPAPYRPRRVDDATGKPAFTDGKGSRPDRLTSRRGTGRPGE
jgi:hypothetical protein